MSTTLFFLCGKVKMRGAPCCSRGLHILLCTQMQKNESVEVGDPTRLWQLESWKKGLPKGRNPLKKKEVTNLWFLLRNMTLTSPSASNPTRHNMKQDVWREGEAVAKEKTLCAKWKLLKGQLIFSKSTFMETNPIDQKKRSNFTCYIIT